MPASPSASGPPPAALVLWCAALFTLPWVGADLIILLTGRDAGAGLQPSWLLLAGAWLAAGRPPRGRRLPAAWRRAVLLACAAVLASVAGLFVAPAPAGLEVAFVRYMKQIMQLLVMAMFLAWPVVHLVGARAWERTAHWLVAGALLQAGYGALQQASGGAPLPLLAALDAVFTSNPSILSGSTMLYVGDRFVDVPRLRGTACEPLYLGNYLLLALPMVALTGWRRRWRLAAGLVLGLLLLLTWSRGAWLGAGAALAVAAWWGRDVVAPAPGRRWRRWRWPLAFIVGLAGLALLAAAAGWEEAGLPLRRLAQSFSQHDWSNLTRLYSLQAAWRAWLLSPVVGIGWGQFGWHFPALVDPTGLQAMFTWPVVANFPLLVLCETGLAGAAALAWASGGLARGVARARRRLPAAERRRLGACAMAAAGIAVQTLTFSQYNLAHAWVALGLLATALLEARGAGEPE
jgi:hypothetical protein